MKRILSALLLAFLISLYPGAGVYSQQTGGNKFMVQRIDVVGSTILSPDEIRAIVAPYEGKELGLDDLKKVADAITAAYRAKGFVFARAYIPPQQVQNGVVQIAVIEGKVGNIIVHGNKNYSTAFIRYYIDGAIRNGRLDYDAFEKALFLLNGFPDLHVEAFLKPGEVPGTTDIVVSVKDGYQLHGGVDYNNFGNPYVGQNRIGVEAWDGDVTGKGDLFDARVVFPFPSKEAPFISGSYTIPVSPDDTTLALTYSNADIHVGSDLEVLDIRGSAQIYGLTANQPLTRTATFSSNVNASFYYKNVADFLFGSFLTSKDKLREIALGWNGSWTGTSTHDLLDADLTQGLGTLAGGEAPSDPYVSRVGSSDFFTKLTADGAHLFKVFGNDYILLRSSAQYSLSPLAITEQFALGGSDSVRGYQQSTFLGDSGWTVSGEFRLPLNAQTGYFPLQMAFFVDSGYTTLRDPAKGEDAKDHLTGGGFGFRSGIGSWGSARIDLGFPMSPLKIGKSPQSPVLYGQFATQF